jgi:hypothetical protein
VSPDEVINKVAVLGVEISRATLLRYENQGLISKPERGGGGAGGRWTDYPDQTVQEVYASWCLLHGNYGSNELREIFDSRPPKISPAAIEKIRLYQLYETMKEVYVLEALCDGTVNKGMSVEEHAKIYKTVLLSTEPEKIKRLYDEFDKECKNDFLSRISSCQDTGQFLEMYGGIYYTLMQNASLKLKGKKDLYETEKMMNNLFRKQNPGD